VTIYSLLCLYIYKEVRLGNKLSIFFEFSIKFTFENNLFNNKKLTRYLSFFNSIHVFIILLLIYPIILGSLSVYLIGNKKKINILSKFKSFLINRLYGGVL
jgi:hypothetical protein